MRSLFILIPVPEQTEVLPENIPLNIVFEDDQIIVINKPVGMVVHPGSGNYTGTLLNGVAWYLQQQNPSVIRRIITAVWISTPYR